MYIYQYIENNLKFIIWEKLQTQNSMYQKFYQKIRNWTGLIRINNSRV